MAATAAGQQTQQQLRTTEKDSDFIIVTIELFPDCDTEKRRNSLWRECGIQMRRSRKCVMMRFPT